MSYLLRIASICILIGIFLGCASFSHFGDLWVIDFISARGSGFALAYFQECLITKGASIKNVSSDSIKGHFKMTFDGAGALPSPDGRVLHVGSLKAFDVEFEDPVTYDKQTAKSCGPLAQKAFNDIWAQLTARLQFDSKSMAGDIVIEGSFYPFEKVIATKIGEAEKPMVVEMSRKQEKEITYEIEFHPADLKKPKWWQEKYSWDLYGRPMPFVIDKKYVEMFR